MGLVKTGLLLSALTVVLFGVIFVKHELIYDLISPVPNKKEVLSFADEVWVTSGKVNADSAIVPFRVDVSDSLLQDLEVRLKNTRFSTAIPNVDFNYGFPASELRKVVDYWLKNFNWKKQQDILNQYPHFKSNIEGLDIHFVRSTPKDTGTNIKVVPIVLVHGWPGSFFELYKLIPLLNKPRQIGSETVAFDVIIPSLPGYGFSDAAQKPGLDTGHIARIFAKLLERLQLKQYVVHGGDWGSMICRHMALMYPERIIGVELTMYPVPSGWSILKTIVDLITPTFVKEPFQSDRLLTSKFVDLLRETGYLHIQATKPDTVGAALQDSPAGLAAYILEKFSTWTNSANVGKPNGGLTNYFSMDDLLTNVMIYWVSGSITSSQRLYKESIPQIRVAERLPVEVPTLLSDFKHELFNPPDEFVKPFYSRLINIVHHDNGGHFPAIERPLELAEDIWSLIKAILLQK